MNKNEIDYLSQSLANKYFILNMIFRIIDSRTNQGRVRQGQEVQRMPLIFDIIGGAVLLFWIILLSFTMLLSVLGLIMIVFHID